MPGTLEIARRPGLPRLELLTVSRGYDRKTCWVHPRVALVDNDPHQAIITMQKLHLQGDDVFLGTYDTRSTDSGMSWSVPQEQVALGPRVLRGDFWEGVSDLAPGWHAASRSLLVTGHTVRYQGLELTPLPRFRSTVYSVLDMENGLAGGTWRPWQKLPMPPGRKFCMAGAGSCQRWDLPNGEILLPIYYVIRASVRHKVPTQAGATVLRCAFDGERLHYLGHGTEMMRRDGRGYVEPSLTQVGGIFYLTLRNDSAGYVTRSPDGLHYEEPRPWRFDDGSELGNYNTQQHWVVNGEQLWLIYTRRGANNDHVMRHRAPLFLAQVDRERLCILRETEQVLVPERGARLCNFGVVQVSEKESWVSVAEWMQTTEPTPLDSRICERYGSDNSVFLAKIHFDD